MSLRLGLTIGVALLAGGCAHDEGGSGEQPELSGVFQAGNVSGVRYQTPTHHGLTDFNGTFKYEAGETVVFSVGGIQLGSATGAWVITPFTLTGATPPTTEPALRLELDRASRTRTPFVRAINIGRLLLALDADSNPANGIDLSGRETTLATATLNFDQTIPQFAEKLDKLAPNLTHNMPRWFPVVHLYRALGIKVPAHAQVHSVSAYEDGAFYILDDTYSYYPDGSFHSRETREGFEGGVSLTTYDYDLMGRTTVTRSSNRIFSQNYFTEVRWSFDVRGTVTGRVEERDEGMDGTIDYGSSGVPEYDAFNNLLHQVSRQDFGHDGTIDWLEDYRATYDARLNLVHSISESDASMDGIIDSRWNTALDYDSRDRVVSQRSEWDGDADGVADSLETWSMSYDANSRPAVETYERDTDVDGDLELRLTYRWAYDDNGNARTIDIVQESYDEASGALQANLRQSNTYDRDGRLLSVVESRDWDGEPGLDVVWRSTYTYDGNGSPLRLVSESDATGDGDVDGRYAIDYVYGTGGELLSMQSSSESGEGATPNLGSRTEVTNALMSDGVLMLAQSYLELSFMAGAVSAF